MRQWGDFAHGGQNMNRTAFEVAAQAIICGSLGFRASIEVTEHPRAEEFCTRLVPWLDELGVGAQIDPYHREILETPHGQLAREDQTEAYWGGESAAVFGWVISRFDMPDRVDPIEPGLLMSNLEILHDSASEVLSGAKLRPQAEIHEYCLYCLEVRHQFQLRTFPGDLQGTMTRIHQNHLAELGLTEVVDRSKLIDQEAAKLVSMAPHAQGLYVVRALAVEWLLGSE